MTRILFIRHGETMFNALNKVQGCSDIALNVTGLRQAKDYILDRTAYDVGIHSGLQRSTATLHHILDNHQCNIPTICDSLVREREYGIFEGLTHNQIQETYPLLYSSWREKENTRIQNAETIEEVIYRGKQFLREMYKSYKNKNIIVVSHSGFMYAMYKWLHKMDLNTKPNITISNCSSYIISFTIADDICHFTFQKDDYEFSSEVSM